MALAIRTQVTEAAGSTEFSDFDRDASLIGNANLLVQRAHEAACDALLASRSGLRLGQSGRLAAPLADARFALSETLELTADLARRTTNGG